MNVKTNRIKNYVSNGCDSIVCIDAASAFFQRNYISLVEKL